MSDSEGTAMPSRAMASLPRIVAPLLLSLALGACFLGGTGASRVSARAPGDSIGIGVGVVPGPARGYIASVVNGIELAVEELNATRPAGSAPFAVRRAPEKDTTATEVAVSLRDDPAVVGVVGHPESGNTLDAIPVYSDAEHSEANAVVAISPTATSPALSGRSPWLFRVAPSDIAASQAVAGFAIDSLQARRAAVIYRNDSYGRDWATAFESTYRSRGGNIVQRDPYLAGKTEWAAYAAYVKQLKPDVLLFPGDAEELEALMIALRAIGGSVTIIGGDGVESLARKTGFHEVRFTSFFVESRATSPRARDFIARYRRKYNLAPDMFAVMSYDAALVIGRAAAATAAGSFPSRRGVRDYIAALGTTGTPIEGAAGPLAFDAKHDVKDRALVVVAGDQ